MANSGDKNMFMELRRSLGTPIATILYWMADSADEPIFFMAKKEKTIKKNLFKSNGNKQKTHSYCHQNENELDHGPQR